MFNIKTNTFNKPLFLAPMEDVTSPGFRKLCKEFGADMVFTEFVNSDGLIRNNKKTYQKMLIYDEERPIGIQIYGGNIDSMIKAAIMAEELNPEVIDINAGCWVKKIAGRGAGAGLLKDPPFMQKMIESIVKIVNVPVTVKTRLGWDKESIVIEEVAKRIEDAGASLLTLHFRTRADGHSGEPDFSWIPKIKKAVGIPIIANGGLMDSEDVLSLYDNYEVDGAMIARGALGNPWLFKEIKERIIERDRKIVISIEERIHTILKHLKYEIEFNEEKSVIIPFRKYYSGYLKGLHNASRYRNLIMKEITYSGIESILLEYLDYLINNELAA